MNKKASGVYDHMPTALYVQSDTFSPDSEETKQDVQPVWNRVPYRTAGRSLIMKPRINKEIASPKWKVDNRWRLCEREAFQNVSFGFA